MGAASNKINDQSDNFFNPEFWFEVWIKKCPGSAKSASKNVCMD